MDNSPQPILPFIETWFEKKQTKLNISYNFSTIHNQSLLRNNSLDILSTSIKYIFFLDSDIYISSATLFKCYEFLQKHSNITAIAPPLAPYNGGRVSFTRNKYKTSVQNSGDELIMPSRLDYERYTKKRVFLESLMLRGAFIVRKSCLEKLFIGKPWHPSFNVWQNVPFFLTLKEAKKKFGYVLYTSIICLHDERPHEDAIRSSMTEWKCETVKSIVLLFYRNKLWLSSQQTLNERFIKTMLELLSEMIEFKGDMLQEILALAKSLTLRKSESKIFLVKYNNDKTKNITFRETAGLLMRISWADLRTIRCKNFEIPM